MIRRTLVLALVALGASSLGAQGAGAAAKQAARNAAAASNAQLAQQTGQQVPKQQAPATAQSKTAVPTQTKAPVTAQANVPVTSRPAVPPQSAAQKPAVPQQPAAQKPAVTGAPAQTPAGAPVATQQGASADSASAAKPADSVKVASLILREQFDYSRDGRRDPFVSLMKTTDLRPTLGDLRLTSVLYDQSGRRPIAILRDSLAGVQWRVTTGMTLGRMRVAAIRPKTVVFTIEEFGFSRQDSLVLGDSTRVRSK